jgi:ubiquinone/menaquinone biosynthesis C-methylase UbiE
VVILVIVIVLIFKKHKQYDGSSELALNYIAKKHLPSIFKRGIVKDDKQSKYISPKTKLQINAILSSGSLTHYYSLCYLISKFMNVKKHDEIIELLNKYDNDEDIYRAIADKNVSSPRDETYMARCIKEQIDFTIGENKYKPINEKSTILDVGCGTCKMIEHIGELYNMAKGNIHGVDIKKWAAYSEEKRKGLNITYETIEEDGVLPFENSKFDLIMCNMVLHHTKPLNKLLSEISRCLNNNGILFIREHAPIGSNDRMIIDIEHMLYASIEGIYPKVLDEYFGDYKNIIDMRALIENKGLKYIISGENITKIDQVINSDKSYWTIFIKK